MRRVTSSSNLNLVPKQPRKVSPFAAIKPPQRDKRVPAKLWDLPRRIEQANLAGPRYNQTELAQKSGLSQSVISKLSNWQNIYGIRLDTIYALARALKVSVAWLLGEADATETHGARPRLPAAADPNATKRERSTHRRMKLAKGTGGSRRRHPAG